MTGVLSKILCNGHQHPPTAPEVVPAEVDLTPTLMCGVDWVRYLPRNALRICVVACLPNRSRLVLFHVFFDALIFISLHFRCFGTKTTPAAHSKSPRLTMYHKQVTSGLSPDAISNDNGQSSTTSAASSNLSSTLTNSTTASSGPDASGSSYAEGPTLTQTPSPTTVRDFASPGLGRGRMRVQGDIVNTKALRQPLTFAFSGRTTMNRLLKAPMTERLCRWNKEGEDIVRPLLFLNYRVNWDRSPKLSTFTSLLRLSNTHLTVSPRLPNTRIHKSLPPLGRRLHRHHRVR